MGRPRKHDHELIKAMHDEGGLSNLEIAEELGLTVGMVRNVLRHDKMLEAAAKYKAKNAERLAAYDKQYRARKGVRIGQPGRPRKHDYALIATMHEEGGLTFREIGEEFGITREHANAIYYRYKKGKGTN